MYLSIFDRVLPNIRNNCGETKNKKIWGMQI